jgi:hypothetical protein
MKLSTLSRKLRLLTLGNQKTAKGEKRGYLTAVLHLAPYTLSGTNLCANAALAECWIPCLNTAGRGGIADGGMVTFETIETNTRTNTVQRARLNRSRWFNNDRASFLDQLQHEIALCETWCRENNYTLCVRLNGTSDIRYEDLAVREFPHIFAAFPDVQFYDYTKLANRRRALGIPNYALVFSYSHAPAFAPQVLKALQTYGAAVNIAVVFAGKLPAHFLGRRVVSGDESDLRFLDPAGVVVGLTAKGNARTRGGSFVVPAQGAI